jgi:hypothetical protein
MDERQELLFTRSVLLAAAIGNLSRYADRLARIDALREEVYVQPERLYSQQRLKLWNITGIDALSAAREEAERTLTLLQRVQQIDDRLAQLPPAA